MFILILYSFVCRRKAEEEKKKKEQEKVLGRNGARTKLSFKLFG